MSRFKRSVVEVIVLFLLVGLTFLLPFNYWEQTPQYKLLALMIQKGMPVSLGVLTGHTSRCFLFPYMDLSKLIEEHHGWGVGFLGTWYVAHILGWAWGG